MVMMICTLYPVQVGGGGTSMQVAVLCYGLIDNMDGWMEGTRKPFVPDDRAV